MWPKKTLEFVKLINDNQGEHFGLYFNAELISIISVFVVENEMQFRKFATCKVHQKKGFGTKLLAHIFALAEQQNISRVWCNARIGKRTYYEKFGMEIAGIPYEKSGIFYVTMEKYF